MDPVRQTSRRMRDKCITKDAPVPAGTGMPPPLGFAGLLDNMSWLDSNPFGQTPYVSDQPYVPGARGAKGSYIYDQGPAYHLQLMQYREPALLSDCGTSSFGLNDSGYGSYKAKRSVATNSVYNDPFEPAEDLDITGDLGNFNFDLESTWTPPGDQPQLLPIGKELRCDKCSKILKTNSELKKHQQRHTKSFTCQVPGCDWRDGFSTQNDLDRHKRSKHPRECADGNKYRCPAEDCKDKDKPWPRLDNFRAHVRRLHPNLTVDDWENCIYRPLQSQFSQDIQPISENSSPAYNSYQEISLSPSLYSLGLPPLPTFETPYENCFYGEFPEAGDCGSDIMTELDDATAPSPSVKGEMLLEDGESTSQPQFVSPGDLTSSAGSPEASRDNDHHCGRSGMRRQTLVLHLDDPAEMEKTIKRLDSREVEKISEVLLRLKADKMSLQVEGIQDLVGSNHDEQNYCPACKKSFTRPSELKKHMKRHEKPYGCTIPGCLKKFGSKNDWKRHENSQHFLLEVWKCDQECSDKPSKTCDKVNHRRETFKMHLEKSHNLSGAVVDEKLESCRRGNRCDTRFWCGFCENVVEIKQQGIDAWTERFNHIDDHYSGRNCLVKKHIDEWKHDSSEAEISGLDLSFSGSGSDEEKPARLSLLSDEKEISTINPQGGKKRKADDSGDEYRQIKRSHIKRLRRDELPVRKEVKSQSAH